MPEEKIKTLYHYTDFNAMRGIVTNGEIWLWNLRRMNDSREMDFFVGELKNTLKNRLEEKFLPRLEELFDSNLKNFENLSSYAACFSEYSDDAAQWARYAKDGMGVCIAFNAELLAKIGEAGHAPLTRVNYSKTVNDEKIVKKLSAMVIKPEKFTSEEINDFFNKLVSSSPLFKHPSFVSEKEYRLVSLPYGLNENLGKPYFYIEENNIKKYFILKLRDVCNSLKLNYIDLFENICIGPQSLVTEDVLSDYFDSVGMQALCSKIRLSECPLRRF